MYVVLALMDSSFEALTSPVKLQYSGPEIGFLPVYATQEQAEAEWPGKEIWEMREVQEP